MAAVNTLHVPFWPADAGEDLSASQYAAVSVYNNSDALEVRLPAVDGEAELVGVVVNDPATGEAAAVQIIGVTKALANAALTIGTLVTGMTTGRVREAEVGEKILGTVVEAAGAQDELVGVMLGAVAGFRVGTTAGLDFETVSAPGAISPTVEVTHLEIDGTDAFTLADGTYVGQRKYILATAAVNTPVGTVTPATFADGTSFALNAVSDGATLSWTATGWKLVQASGITITP